MLHLQVTPASKPNLPIRKSQRPQEPHLKRPFKIPSEFPASAKSGLQKKQLFGRSRTKFITTVAQAIQWNLAIQATHSGLINEVATFHNNRANQATTKI